MKRSLTKIALASLSLGIAFNAMAWNHGISIGYGGGPDPSHTEYNNSGGIINAEILSIKQSNRYNLTFDGSLGDWYSNTPSNKDLFTAALTLTFRVYLAQTAGIHPYLLGSTGPAYLSERKFGLNNQAANFAFQSSLGAGVEFGKAKRLDLNLKLIHYSNMTLMYPNQGINIVYVGSIGYLF